MGKALGTNKAFVVLIFEEPADWNYQINRALRKDGACSMYLDA
jgi:hypothetical protein